ncbi:phage tail protein I [Janthinobacterium sp. HLX7-2]|uniref:phage tail protein I n=1 Tax=Janthinobacterium sp. HLX7-2 TaxID=1259331 RepID=UPI003F28BA41
MINLLPPNASAIERAIAATGAGIDTLPVAVREIWNPATCPAALLAWLAWALAVDEWDEAWSEAVKRTVIADAIQVHRHRGTVWSLKKSLAPLGMAVEVIDQASQRASYAALESAQLDGSWQLDSTTKIRPIELYANLPQIQHWAQFIVRANLADAVRAENFTVLRHLVEKWKPARSWPLFMFWLMFALEVRAQASAALLLNKQIGARYPWSGRTISDAASWPLGRDGSPVTLPQAFSSFRLGERRGAISAWRLTGSRVDSNACMQSAASISVYRLPQLAEIDRRLNGAWRLGERIAGAASHSTIVASSVITSPQKVAITYHTAIRIDYPATPAKLGARTRLAAWRRLDGLWAVGSNTTACPFGFALRRDEAIQAEANIAMASTSASYVSPERLARRAPVKMAPTVRRLDGSWRPGAENRLGRFRLDGRRLRVQQFVTCPRIGTFAVMQGVSGTDEGASRRLHLNGGWRLGGPAAPQFNINIMKEVQHG